MIIAEERRIVREVKVYDGTTAGKIIYQDNYGNYWQRTHMTRDSHGTADTIATMSQGKLYL